MMMLVMVRRAIVYFIVIGENILRLFFCSRQFGLSFATSVSKGTLRLFVAPLKKKTNSRHTHLIE